MIGEFFIALFGLSYLGAKTAGSKLSSIAHNYNYRTDEANKADFINKWTDDLLEYRCKEDLGDSSMRSEIYARIEDYKKNDGYFVRAEAELWEPVGIVELDGSLNLRGRDDPLLNLYMHTYNKRPLAEAKWRANILFIDSYKLAPRNVYDQYIVSRDRFLTKQETVYNKNQALLKSMHEKYDFRTEKMYKDKLINMKSYMGSKSDLQEDYKNIWDRIERYKVGGGHIPENQIKIWDSVGRRRLEIYHGLFPKHSDIPLQNVDKILRLLMTTHGKSTLAEAIETKILLFEHGYFHDTWKYDFYRTNPIIK